MHNRITIIAAATAGLLGSAIAIPATASAATLPPTTSTAATASTNAEASITVTTPDTYTPYSRVTVKGTATPKTDVFIALPHAPASARVRSDLHGNWEWTTPNTLAGNLPRNTATVIGADGSVAQVTFDLRAVLPAPSNPEASFRPVVVSSTDRDGSAARASGTATPGALIVVRSPGWEQGTTVAAEDGTWTVGLAQGHGPWVRTEAIQQHAAGTSATTFTLGS